MDHKYVKTIRDLIYMRYANILARQKYGISDDREIQYIHYGFVKSAFKAIKFGSKTWDEIIKGNGEIVEEENRCVYCGNEKDSLKKEPLIPNTVKILSECPTCEKRNEIQTQVIVCKQCSASKGSLGLYEYFNKTKAGDIFFYEKIPTLLEKKYMHTIYYCHECAGTLEKGDLDGDGNLTVLDIDYILH